MSRPLRLVHFSASPLAGMPLRLVRARRRHAGLDARLVEPVDHGLLGRDVVPGRGRRRRRPGPARRDRFVGDMESEAFHEEPYRLEN